MKTPFKCFFFHANLNIAVIAPCRFITNWNKNKVQINVSWFLVEFVFRSLWLHGHWMRSKWKLHLNVFFFPWQPEHCCYSVMPFHNTLEQGPNKRFLVSYRGIFLTNILIVAFVHFLGLSCQSFVRTITSSWSVDKLAFWTVQLRGWEFWPVSRAWLGTGWH